MVDFTPKWCRNFLEGVALGLVGPWFFTSLLPYKVTENFGPKSKPNMSRYAVDAISHTISRRCARVERPISMQQKNRKDFHRWLVQLEYNTPKISQNWGGGGR